MNGSRSRLDHHSAPAQVLTRVWDKSFWDTDHTGKHGRFRKITEKIREVCTEPVEVSVPQGPFRFPS
jgi:hypothetical protein